MTIHITEFSDSGVDRGGGRMFVPQMPPVATQGPIALGAQSAAFNTKTLYIYLFAKVDCYVAIGSNPTATAQSTRMAAGQFMYFGVHPGHKAHAIAAA